MGVGGNFFGEMRYEGVRFNVISVTGGWWGPISRKKHYVTLEWPTKTLLKVTPDVLLLNE